MAKTVSVTLKLIDQISQKLDAIANSADGVFDKISNVCDKMEQAFERATSEAERLRESMQSVTNSASDYAGRGSDVAQALEEQADAADRAAQALEEHTDAADMVAQRLEEQADAEDIAVQALEAHTDAVDTAVQALDEQADAADTVTQALEEQAETAEDVARALEDFEDTAGTVSDGLGNLGDDIDGLGSQLGGLEGGLGGLDDQLGGLDSQVDGLGDSMNESEQAVLDLSDALAAAGIAVALGKIADAYNACDEAADKFESSMAKVGTIADTSAVSLDSIQKEIQDLSSETGVGVSDLAESVYSAISASVDTADAVSFVAQANALAVGGFTQTTTAVDILTTALNAYGLEADQTSNIADMLIQTQNLGKTTVDELASSMGKVIPTAKSLGVELDVLCGSYAVMTANGIATAETTTYFNSMLNELGKNGTSAAAALAEGTQNIKAGGLTMAEAMERGLSLTDVLGVLDEQARKSGTSISNMFGSAEAGKAANVLWGNAEKVDKAIKQMGNSAGAAQTAFEKMSDTSEFVDQKWQNALENLKIAIGNAQPSLDGLMEKGTEIVNKLSEFVEANPEVVGAIEGAAVALGAFTVAIGAYSAATLVAAKATEIFTKAASGNGIFLLATALASAAVGIGVFVSSLEEAESVEDKLTGTSLKLSNEIEEQREVVESLKETHESNDAVLVEAQARLEELEAQYGETTEKIGDFNAKIRGTIDAIESSKNKYEENSDALDDQTLHAAALIKQLEDLQSQQELNAFGMAREKDIVAQLNDIYPELGLSYDEAGRQLGMSTDYLEKFCEQKQKELKLQQDAERYDELETEKADLYAAQAEAKQHLTDAQSEYNRILEEANAVLESDPSANLSAYHEEIADAAIAVEEAEKALDTLRPQIAYVETEMGNLQSSADEAARSLESFAAGEDGVVKTTEELRTAMQGAFDNVQEDAEGLAEAYKSAYDAAASAVDGSFGLFEKIELESTQSARDMVDALNSQREYLEEYTENIEKAKEYGIDASLVENLADGSQESAAALDTIIEKIESLGASTDDAKKYIGEMNDSFSSVQEAKQTLEDTMVDMNTSLQAQTEELKNTLEIGIEGLNLSTEAKSAAEKTIDAFISGIASRQSAVFEAVANVSMSASAALGGTFVGKSNVMYAGGYQGGANGGQGIIDGVTSKYPAIENVFTNAADIAIGAYKKTQEINSPSKVFKELSEYTVDGIVEGVEENQVRVADTYEGLAETTASRYGDKISELALLTDEYLGSAAEKYGEYSDESAKAMEFVIGKLDELAESYSANYDSAYQSISGKLGLFEDMEFGTSKSVDEMMESLKSQTDYMAEYGAYMKNAMEMGVDSGMLEKLSDGSKESAAILKEIVTNGADKIDELNANFAKVEQGKETFAAAMAEMETYYGKELDTMVADMEKAVEDMNQHDEAYQSAQDTCKGLIDGINSQWDLVIGKYAELSQAASAAFVPAFTGGIDIAGHAGGTTYGENVYIAGEDGPELIIGRRGSEVFPASETAKILSAVMNNREAGADISMAPQEIINTVIRESNSASTNTENKNLTLTIKGKGALDIGQSVSRKDLMGFMRDELEDAIMNIVMREMYEEGEGAYEF